VSPGSVHKGWYRAGTFRDHVGAVVAWTEASHSAPPKPPHEPMPINPVKAVRPTKPAMPRGPLKPVDASTWSALTWAAYVK
jgi:hypothetical protein